MSITFYNDAKCNWKKDLPCYCTNEILYGLNYDMMQSGGDEYINTMWEISHKLLIGENVTEKEKQHLLANINQFSREGCQKCGGSGINSKTGKWSPPIYIKWSNDNAYRVLELMGIPDDDLSLGHLSISKARQAIFRALNKSVDSAVRQEEIVYDKPRQNEDGTVELKPIKIRSPGLYEGDIVDRLNKLMEFVLMSAEQGATEISWE